MNKGTLIHSILALAPVQFAQGVVFNNSVVSIIDDTAGGHLILGHTTTPVAVAPFTPQVGDVLVTEVTFANGDRLRINDGPNVVDSTGSRFSKAWCFFSTTAVPIPEAVRARPVARPRLMVSKAT